MICWLEPGTRLGNPARRPQRHIGIQGGDHEELSSSHRLACACWRACCVLIIEQHDCRSHYRADISCSNFLTTIPSPSPSPSSSPTTPIPATPAPTPVATTAALPAPTAASGAWCKATASVYYAPDDENNVYVNSDRPYTSATASADGYSWSYETNGSGYALIYLNGPPPGAEITVTVGGATCTTSD